MPYLLELSWTGGSSSLFIIKSIKIINGLLVVNICSESVSRAQDSYFFIAVPELNLYLLKIRLVGIIQY